MTTAIMVNFYKWLADDQGIHRAEIVFTRIDVVADGDERVLVLTRGGEFVEAVRLSGPISTHLATLLAPAPAVGDATEATP